MVVTKTLTIRKRYDQVIDCVVDTNKTNPINNNINYVSYMRINIQEDNNVYFVATR